MSHNVTSGRSSPPVDSYASYSSSSDEGTHPVGNASTFLDPLSDDCHVPDRASWSQLPPEISRRLQLTEPFGLHFGRNQFDDTSDQDSDESECASNGSSVAGSSVENGFENPAPCTTMDEIIPIEPNAKGNQCYAQTPTIESLGIYDDSDNKDTQAIQNAHHSRSSSNTVMSTLKKRWKGMKKAGARGTSSAGKSLSSISASYFSGGREAETWEERHSRIADEWINSVIPAWNKKRKTARVRSLVFRGIPANVRGRAWQCAIGNPLNVSEELFLVLKDRAVKGREDYLKGRDTLALADGDVGGHGGYAESLMESERSAHKAISLDLPRTFPELSFFHAEGSHYEHALRDILEAFLYLKPEVGYSQGMSFVAAVLLLYMDPYEAFACFANMLLYKSCFLHFFRIKMPEVRCYLMVHERLLAEEMPALHLHFKRYDIEPDLYMINWVMSLYCRALPLDLVTRIWDLYVVDGDVAIFRAALGILRMFMSKLLKMKFEDMAYFLSHIPSEEIQADEMLQSIRCVRVVTRKRFRDLFRECHDELTKSDKNIPSNKTVKIDPSSIHD